MTNADTIRDVIIVGSSPAGWTAAIYAARAELSPLVVAGSVTAGGALINTTEVENFPGFLTKFARSVTIVHRRDALRASKVMAARAHSNDKIRFEWSAEVAAIHGEDQLEGITLRSTIDGTERDIAISGQFVAIGHLPRTELVTGQVSLDDEGYIEVIGRSTATNLDGVFACGDAVDHTYRQAITAAGSGCAAALDAERFLTALEDSTAEKATKETIHA